jgi:hypothetical protein
MNINSKQTPAPQLDKSALGPSITSWVYKPARSDKFWISAAGVIAALVFFTLQWGDQILPWLKHIPSSMFYIAIFILSPLMKYVTSMGKDEVWTLYENGYTMARQDKGSLQDERIGYWKDFSGCTYDSKGVKLISANPMRPGTRIKARANLMEVYPIARERIAIAHAQKVSQSVQTPSVPNTREQRYLQRAHQKYSHMERRKTGFWNSFVEENK